MFPTNDLLMKNYKYINPYREKNINTQNEFEVDSRDEFDAGLHGVCLLSRHKYIYFNRF